MRRAVAILACLGLAGCNLATGELDASTQNKLNVALAATCPFLPVLQHTTANAPDSVKTAFYVMEASCPPNSPPTNLYTVLAVIAAAVVLRPYER